MEGLLGVLNSSVKKMKDFIELVKKNNDPQFILEKDNTEKIECLCFTKEFGKYFGTILRNIANTYFNGDAQQIILEQAKDVEH